MIQGQQTASTSTSNGMYHENHGGTNGEGYRLFSQPMGADYRTRLADGGSGGTGTGPAAAGDTQWQDGAVSV